MIDARWSKWIARSVFSFLETEIHSAYPSMQLLVDGSPEPGANRDQEKIELRMDGPFFTPMPNNEWRARVEINVMLTSMVGDRNIYYHRDVRGTVETALSKSICLYKYGDGDAHFGVLRIGRVVSSYLGRIEADTVLEQSVVEVAATADLTGV